MVSLVSGLSLAKVSRVTSTCRPTTLDRRSFVRSLAGFSVAAVFPGMWSATSLRLGIIASSDDANGVRALEHGVSLGLAEAARAAALFGRGTIARSDDAPQVIVAFTGDEDLRKRVERTQSLIINCRSRSDALRRAVCSPLLFHVEASDAMYLAAARLAPQQSTLALWSPALEKYGAAQLNDRYRAAYMLPMSPAAWAGWFAVKVVWESFLRSGSNDANVIARFMAAESSQFDGHKGASLSFRSWDHQLRQPLYAVSASGGMPRDIPDLARSPGGSRDVLDSLGDDSSMSSCSRQ